MVLAGGDVSAADRRGAVRELAGVSPATFDDAAIDRKTENWDAAALAYFDDPPTPEAQPFFRLIVNVSNLLTAAAIRQGIGGDGNTRTAEAQVALAKSLVSAHNRREPEQARQAVARTRGIGRFRGESDQSRGAFG